MNIKLNSVIIPNVDIVESGEMLGLSFSYDTTLTELENLFSPDNLNEFQIIDDDNNVLKIFKNQRLTALSYDIQDDQKYFKITLQVGSLKLTEIDELNNLINQQNIKIQAQNETILAQKEELAKLESSLLEANDKITQTTLYIAETQVSLQETKNENEMLMNCILELSEIVYA